MEQKQANNWFVAYEQGMELRLSGWNSRNRTRPGAKHLCGQACLYRLLEEFMARVVAMKPAVEGVKPATARVRAATVTSLTDTSLTSNTAYIGESARLIDPAAELVTMPTKSEDAGRPVLVDEGPRYGSRNWRAEAWDREMEREQHEGGLRPDLMARHGL
jgi:hypothetical protein